MTQISPNGPATPFSAFLDVSAHSIGGANLVGPFITQEFSGTFSINGAADGSGTNYLAGTFSDGALTANGAIQIVVAAPDVTFTSDVILALGEPNALGFSLTNVLPPVTLTACTASNPGSNRADDQQLHRGGGGQRICHRSRAGDDRAVGASLLGLGVLRRRRKAGSMLMT